MAQGGYLTFDEIVSYWRERKPKERLALFGEAFATRFDRRLRCYIAEQTVNSAASVGPGRYKTIARLKSELLAFAPEMEGSSAFDKLKN